MNVWLLLMMAASQEAATTWAEALSVQHLTAAAVYSAIGLLLFVGGFVILDKFTPGNMWKEIFEQKNVALAVLVGSMAIGLAIIIAAAIHG